MNSYRLSLEQKYPDCWQWISLVQRFPGRLTENEATSLFHLARARTPLNDPAIVELGACGARTTLLLAAGLRGKTRPRLFAFEQIGGERSSHRLLERCRLEHIVGTTAGRPDNAATSWKDAIDILLINASGDDDTLHSHLSLWSPLVRPRGIVALHGISTESSALLLPAPHYGEFRQVDKLAWAVKQCTEVAAAIPGVPATLHAAQQETAMARLQDFVRGAARELAENRHAIQALRRSWSWRLTAPLRFAVETLQAIAGVLASFGQGPAKARMVGLAQWLWFGRQVRASGLLDDRYYRDSHPGVAWARTSPLLHFFVSGASEGNQPNELFDVDYYLGRYPDVARSPLNPLVHYLRSGAYEGRYPHPHFDSRFYLEQNPDVRERRLNPLAHYLAPGIVEGRDPNPWFDTSEYLEQNPDVAIFGLNPLRHQTQAWRQTRPAEIWLKS